MAFKKSGMSVPVAFTKRNNSESNFRQYPRDLLVVLKEVHSAADGQGSLIVAETRKDGSERIYNVRIKNATIERLKNNKNVNSTTRKWSGGLIDDAFEKENKPEDVLMLEQTLSTGPKKTVNGVETYFIETNWIHSGDPDETKNFRACFTIGAYNGRVSSARRLPERNIFVSDDESIEEVRVQLKEIEEAVKNGEFMPGLAISFHTLVPHVLKNGNEGYKEIDRTPPFSWVSAEKDADGKVITEGRLINSADFDDLLEGYLDYIYGPEDKSAVGKFDEETLEKVKVEVMVGTNYRASNMSDSLVINPQYTGAPLYRMANTETKYSMDDEGFIKTQNIAVDGIVMLSGDKMEKVGRDVKLIRRDLVTRLFTNGPIKDASEMVLSSDGLGIEVDERLKAPNTYTQNTGSANTSASQARTEKSVNSTPVETESENAFDLPDDIFGEPSNNSDSHEENNTSDDPFKDDSSFFSDNDDDVFGSNDTPFGEDTKETETEKEEETKSSSRGGRSSRRDV